MINTNVLAAMVGGFADILPSTVFPILSKPESLQALADVRLITVHTHVFTAVVYCLADIFPSAGFSIFTEYIPFKASAGKRVFAAYT